MEYILRHAENQMKSVNTTKRNQAPKLLFALTDFGVSGLHAVLHEGSIGLGSQQ